MGVARSHLFLCLKITDVTFPSARATQGCAPKLGIATQVHPFPNVELKGNGDIKE